MKNTNILKILVIALIIVLDIIIILMVSGNKSDDGEKSSGENEMAEMPLTDRGEDIITAMDRLAGDENYRRLIIDNDEIEGIINEIVAMDYTSPKQVYRITNLDDLSEHYLSMGEAEVNSLSKEDEEYIINKFALGIGNIFIAQNSGTSALAASSVFVRQEIFVDKSVNERTVYLYIYDKAYPVLISFIPGQDGAVIANASYLIIDELIGAEKETIEDVMKLGIFSIKLEKAE